MRVYAYEYIGLLQRFFFFLLSKVEVDGVAEEDVSWSELWWRSTSYTRREREGVREEEESR